MNGRPLSSQPRAVSKKITFSSWSTSCDSKKNKSVCDLRGDEFYTKQDFLSKSFSIPPLLSSYLQGIYFLYHIYQFVSELINKQKSRKSGISTIAENKLYAAHHKTQLHTMKVYNTRPVSLTIKVLLIKTVLFFNHWSNHLFHWK